MKIVQLVMRRQRRGAEVFAAQLSDALVEHGHEVTVVGLYAPPANPLTPDAAQVFDLAAGASGGKLRPGLVLELARYLRSAAPDVVQANGSDTLKYSVLAKRLLGARWPLVYRNISLASFWLRSRAQRSWGRWLARSVDHVAAVSRECGEDFQRAYGVPASRVSTIPIGVHLPETDQRQALRERLSVLAGIARQAEIVIHIGSFSPEKNHLWLLEAFADIRRHRPDAHLVLLGDGPLRSQVEETITARGLSASVHALGSRKDASELVGGADLLVLPSRIEGIPGVVLEAAAHAVPAVATAVGGIPEAVHHGTTGLLVEPDDRAAFVAAVAQLLDCPPQRLRLGSAARDLVAREYHLARIVADFDRLYRNLIPSPQN